jgi:hypothetical protein
MKAFPRERFSSEVALSPTVVGLEFWVRFPRATALGAKGPHLITEQL